MELSGRNNLGGNCLAGIVPDGTLGWNCPGWKCHGTIYGSSRYHHATAVMKLDVDLNLHLVLKSALKADV